MSRARTSGNTFRNGDCSSATASATFNAPSKTGSSGRIVEISQDDRVLLGQRGGPWRDER